MLTTFVSIVVMLLGFGFVIFWHELGHFLGARWAGVRVEQFAVGMGHAVVSFRKGIGFRIGSTQKEFEKRVEAELKRRSFIGEATVREVYDVARDLGISETEYRLSMLPIGGYVKPTGQDDLRGPEEAAQDDPHSYAAATVGKRMVIISAGVIMNVILAAILFFVLFRVVGFKSPRAEVGDVQSSSPAAAAGLRPGDELLSLDGTTLHDFTKVLMNVALLPADRMVDVKIRRDGVEKTLAIQARPSASNNGVLTIGINGPRLLSAWPADKLTPEAKEELADLPPEQRIVEPGETIIAVNGTPVKPTDYAILDRAIQSAYGKPVTITIQKGKDGPTREATFTAPFAAAFNLQTLRFVGLSPRTVIKEVLDDSAAKGVLMAGDIVTRVQSTSMEKPIEFPAVESFSRVAQAAGKAGDKLQLSVLRDGKAIDLPTLDPNVKLKSGGRGLNVRLESDLDRAIVGEVEMGTDVAKAGIAGGSTIVSINDQPVANWADVHRVLAGCESGKDVKIAYVKDGGTSAVASFALSREDALSVAQVRYANPIGMLEENTIVRHTDSALTAVGWGVGETRDLILQGYLTLKRVLLDRSVPASQMSGPLGIARAGTMFAQRGTDWFIWFLAVISANLAVVNFLPVPILDGWHFLSLLKEKVTGRPLSHRVQEIAQYVGLVMILSLVVFVTYNDILRFIS